MLVGNGAANVLNGAGGSDTMVGAAGDDTYVVDASADLIVEAPDQGRDTVMTTASYALPEHVENLTLKGASSIDATGNALANALMGNGGRNTLVGGAGNDTLNGGAGNDTLIGGPGDDTYWLGRGSGSDAITENDATPGNADLVQFAGGVAAEQIWFRQLGDSLEVSVLGTNDRLTINDWYLGAAFHVEQFRTTDGASLLDAQVQSLVQAMSAFSPPAIGQFSLAPEYAATLAPIIAANWH